MVYCQCFSCQRFFWMNEHQQNISMHVWLILRYLSQYFDRYTIKKMLTNDSSQSNRDSYSFLVMHFSLFVVHFNKQSSRRCCETKHHARTYIMQSIRHFHFDRFYHYYHCCRIISNLSQILMIFRSFFTFSLYERGFFSWWKFCRRKTERHFLFNGFNNSKLSTEKLYLDRIRSWEYVPREYVPESTCLGSTCLGSMCLWIRAIPDVDQVTLQEKETIQEILFPLRH